MYVDVIFILQACLTLVPVHIMSGTKPMSTVDTHKQHPEILLSSIASRIRTIHEVFEYSKSYPSDEITISLKYLGCCEAADVVINFSLTPKGHFATTPMEGLTQPIGRPTVEGLRCDLDGALHAATEGVRKVFSPTAAVHAG